MDKKRAIKATTLLLAAALGLTALYLLRPPCLILQYTGFYCAGCGTQRMLTALLRGDIPAAFSHNPFMFIVLPLTAACVLCEAYRYARHKRPLYKAKYAPHVILSLLAAAILFTVLRNLPGFTLLGP